MRLHLHLEHVVKLNRVAPHVGQAWVLDDYASRHVPGDNIVLEERCRLLLGKDPSRVVFDDFVVFDGAFRVD